MSDQGQDWNAFCKRHYRYALSKGTPKESAEEFPAYVWERRFVREYNCNIHQHWLNFLTLRFGKINSPTHQAKKAIAFRKIKMSAESEEDYLENAVAAKELPTYYFKHPDLSERESILIFLLEAGWKFDKISKAYPEVDFQDCLRTIGKKISLNEDWKKAFYSNIETPDHFQARYKTSQQAEAATVDLSRVNFSDFLDSQ